MERNFVEYIIFDNVTPVAITSSTDATPIVMTVTAHGFNTGDLVLIHGHTTNVAANGIYRVTRLTANTFSLQDQFSGANIAGSGAGAGSSSGYVMKAPLTVPLVEDFRNVIFSLHTTGSATLTFSVAGSLGKLNNSSANLSQNMPNFSATQSPSNPYSFLQSINLDSGATVNGSTGIATTSTDINNMFEVNINGVKYIALYPTAWTAGAITVKIQLYSNI